MASAWVSLDQINTPNLQRNLAYLQVMDGDLCQRLQTQYHDEPLEFQNQAGFIRCRVKEEPPRWLLGKNHLESEIQTIRKQVRQRAEEANVILLLGNALGYALAELLPLIVQNPGLRVFVVERSYARLRACLAFLDIRAAYESGRLALTVGEPSTRGVIEAVRPFSPWRLEEPAVYCPPEDGWNEIESLRKQWREEKCNYVHSRQSVIETVAARAYQEEITTRVLLLDCWPGAPGEAHIRAIQRALKQRGIEAPVIPFNRYLIERHGVEYRRRMEGKLLQAFEEVQPQWVLSYGYHGHQLVEPALMEKSGAVWLQVVSNIAYFDTTYSPIEHSALIERRLIPSFQKRGADHPFFVPLMADYSSPHPLPTNRAIPILFVGNSLGLPPSAVSEFMQRWQGREALVAYIQKAEQELSSFDSQLNLYDYLEDSPPPQLQSLEEEYAVFRYLLCQASAARRKKLLEKLLPCGLVLYGGDWENYLPSDSPLRACLKGPLPMQDEPKLFSYTHIFLNIHSIGHVTGPNMRFFNVAGLGGFQISDGKHFGEYLQPGEETVFYYSEEELLEQVRYYIAHPEKAERFRDQGHARVRRDWTYQNWLDWIERELSITLPKERS